MSEVVLDLIYPEHGWTEQNPNTIIESMMDLIENCLLRHSIDPASIQAIALTNLKNSVVAFNKDNGQVLTNLITPNDKRVEKLRSQLEKKNCNKILSKKALIHSSNTLAALKMLWIQENCAQAKKLHQEGKLAFATLESFIIYRLSSNKVFVTDITNAHATGLVNIETLTYDDELLNFFNINRNSLAQIKATNEVFATIKLPLFPKPLKIISSMCNHQSAILASGTLNKGEIKCTFSSTSSIFLQLDEKKPTYSSHFSHTISQKLLGQPHQYCVESTIYHSGSIIKWLQDSLGLIHTSREVEALAYSVPDSGGLFFVPTFSGVGAPYWDHSLQGTILGIKESTNIGHLARASLEGIAYQISDTIKALLKVNKVEIDTIKCGGKMAKDTFLMQMLANLLGIKVITCFTFETPLLGTALLAHLTLKNIKSLNEIASLFKHDQIYEPNIEAKQAKMMLKNWHIALETTKHWSNKIA